MTQTELTPTTSRTGKWKPYPAYKDSGVEWLGEMPAHWKVKRLKYAAPSSTAKLTEKPDDLPYLGLENIESQTGRLLLDTPIENVESTVGLFNSGNVLFGKLRPYLAKVVYVDFSGVCTTELLVLQPKAIVNGKFLFYRLLSEDFIKLVNSLTYGTKMPRVSGEQIGNLPVSLPPLAEQRSIATFLDRETAKINALIAKKEQLIELLQEKRVALISHAVTKGLDPTVPMKDSDVEWLGEVPANWEVKRIKNVLHQMIDTEHKTAPFYPDGEYLVVRTSNVRNGKLLLDDAKYTNYEGYIEWTQRGKPAAGDILFTREAPAGEACLVPDNILLCIGQRMVLFRVNKKLIDGRYGVWSLYGGIAKEFIRSLSQGSTVVHFNISDIGNIPLLVPPLFEQQVIVKFIDRETAKIDAFISRIQEGIKKLREYSTALISAAVTGKIDVREEIPYWIMETSKEEADA